MKATFRHLSYRYKIPLSLSLAILFTGLVVTVTLAWRAYEDLRDELFRNAADVGGILSNTLPDIIKHDDLWLAYRTLGAAVTQTDEIDERRLIVLDADYRVYVSNQPRRFPVLSELRTQGPELARVAAEVAAGRSLQPHALDHPENDHIYVLLPILDDGVSLGTLIIGYSRSLFLPRFYGIIRRVAYSSLAVMALLLPLGWYLGKRMMTPLIELEACMSKVGRLPIDEIECTLPEGNDEIGRLGVRFRQMLAELQEKHRVEQQVITSERLAAVGRLAAGVAHEINNPLGGILNAINTLRRHGKPDEVSEKTLALVQRGLDQIRETVSALLVEVRAESHALTPQDINDIHTLLQPDADSRGVILNWQNQVDQSVPLPSTQIRQLLINLSLNAVQAAPTGSAVGCRIAAERQLFLIEVDNEGDVIAQDTIDRLFEPFVHDNPTGIGLGLWVTYQIVQQLRGEIDVSREAQRTSFLVRVPLEKAA